MMLPQAFETGVYSEITLPIAHALYSILYLTFVVGVVVLMQHCLSEKKVGTCKVTLRRLVDTVFLVFVEFFYLLVWNIYFPFRAIQLLLIIASALVYYYHLVIQTELSYYIAALMFVAYFILVVYNAIRLFFSTTVFCQRDMSIKECVKESWYLTHNRFNEAFYAIALALALAFVLYWFLTIAFGAFASIVLKLFFADFLSNTFVFIDEAAMLIGFKAAGAFALGPVLIAYHYAITEGYVQLASHKSSSHSIKRILAHRTLHKKSKAPVRKFAKKRKR